MRNKENALDHIVNKVCYSSLWGYDFIFNQTYELTPAFLEEEEDAASTGKNTKTTKNAMKDIDRWWLKYGCWDRIAHLQSALPHYDWIVYGDLDYIIKDLSRPIESFIKEFELYGKNDVQVFLPSDHNDREYNNYVFSSYGLMVKNSPFGRRLLENWREFANGLCPKGNFAYETKEYEWYHGDQPGLWYALMKTHMDHFPNNNSYHSPSIIECNETSGFIDESKNSKWLGFEDYFGENGFEVGNYDENLEKVPKSQPIIFSRSSNDSMSGLGVDHNYMYSAEEGVKYWHTAFALHQKAASSEWDPVMRTELAMCKEERGCYANAIDNGFEFGCNNTL